MILSTITINGFRNFKSAKINLNKKSLIIGSNDVGKTNCIWAIRLLLDRSLSDLDIEPEDSDFYAYEETNTFDITLKFTKITEECILAKMKGKVSDKGTMYLKYIGLRDNETRIKTFKLMAGASINKLEEIEDRYYRKVLNIRYISSKRDFHSYINKEKVFLLQNAKEERNPEAIASDARILQSIQNDLTKVDKSIPKLSFVSSATKIINTELAELSAHNSRESIVFDASASDSDKFIGSVAIASQNNGKSIKIGGDGRLNQIYLALWASRNTLSQNNENEVSIVCIEEPEAHLHPHQQRKLADYLNKNIAGQVIITSHSPQIASEFSPNSIIRLFTTNTGTLAASDGCSEIIEKSFKDFGYRMSIIPAEAFFSDAVLLIEGPSEYHFYKSLAKQLQIDLDNLNISILMVDGVGFPTYIKILKALKIAWVLRTDNDVSKVPNKSEYRFAGIERCMNFYKKFYDEDDTLNAVIEKHEDYLRWSTSEPPVKSQTARQTIRKALEKLGMFVSEKDLENDLYNSKICDEIKSFLNTNEKDETISKMQSMKATFMFAFLKDCHKSLANLSTDNLSRPLLHCKQIIDKLYEANYATTSHN